MNKQLQHLLTFMLCTAFVSPIAAQSEWEHFVTRGQSLDVEYYDNNAYIANRSGLLIVDLETREETLIHPGNHSVPVQGFREIEILENGHMWLSSAQDGYLYYFDGETFTPHCDSISLITNLVLANDRLWFMSGGTIDYPILDQGELFSLHSDQCTNHGDLDILSLRRDQHDKFWYTTANFIHQFDGEEIVESLPLPNQIFIVYDHYIDSQDRHWLSTDISVPFLYIYEDGEWITSFTSHFVEKFYEFEPTNISGLLVDDRYVEFMDYQAVNAEFPLPLPAGNRILRMDSESSMWLTTENRFHNSRLFWTTPDTTQEFGAREDLLPSTIVDIAEDCEGNLLAAARLSVEKYVAGQWQSIPLASNNEDCYLGRFIIDPFTCEPWLGGGGDNSCLSIWELMDDILTETEILPQYRLYLYRDQPGNIYFTTPSPATIHKIDTDGVYSTIQVPGSISALDIRFLASGKLVVLSSDEGTQNRSIRILEDGEWSQLDLSSLSIPDLRLQAFIHQDSEGHLWFHETNGFVEYDGEELTYFPVGEGFEDTDRSTIVEDSYGRFWIATRRDGILRWTPDEVMIFNTSNSELLSNACRELQIIDGYLWVNHYHGLTKFRIDEINNSTEEMEVNSLQYTLYPNPSSGQITLTNPLLEKRTIDIFNSKCVLISSDQSTDAVWRMNLEAGVYFMVIRQTSGEVVEKVVVLE